MEQTGSSYSLKVFPAMEREAQICFKLLQKSFIVLKIMSGDNLDVRLLINEVLEPGEQSILFSYGNLQAGDYRIRLMVNNDDAIDIENVNFKIS